MKDEITVNSCHHIVGHNAISISDPLKPLDRKGLQDVKKSEKNKSEEDMNRRRWYESHRHQKASNLIDHNPATVSFNKNHLRRSGKPPGHE